MSRPSSPLWRRGLPLAAAVVTLVGFAVAFAPHAPAQGKKAKSDEASKKSEEGEKKAEPKEEARPEPVIPKVVDVMDGSKGGLEQVGYTNELIAKGWKDNKVHPSARATDYEFIRRASLDVLGRIPTVAEIRRFMADPPNRRRSMLVERMLEGKEYGEGQEFAENLANMWTTMLMTRSGSPAPYQEQMRDWLTRQLKGKDGAPDWSKIATEIITASGDTNKRPAVNFVLQHLGEEIKEDPMAGITRATAGRFDTVPLTSRTTRLFLGIRVQCVQCHDHPFNGEWGQHHFWGINAFFRQLDTSGRPTMMGKKMKGEQGLQQYTVSENSLYNSDGKVGYERRNALFLFTVPTFLDGKQIKLNSDESRRQALAKFITKSEYFSKAFVNRMWGHFLGKSFTKDGADDFGEHNPESHPELLRKLAEDWATKYKHNPKDLVRWICNSQAYGLSSQANKYNDKAEDEVFFARVLLKPMSPEQLFESLMTATQKPTKDKDERLAKRKAWLDTLVVNFGNDEGEEGSFNGTVIQALMLMNGQEINDAIMDRKEGTVAHVIKNLAKTHDQALDYLYKAALSRPPTKDEVNRILHSPKDTMRVLPRATGNSQAASWEGYYQDIFWALLNSNEFILNH